MIPLEQGEHIVINNLDEFANYLLPWRVYYYDFIAKINQK